MSIITPQQFADTRDDISSGWQKEIGKIQRCIDEAEEIDLYDVFGNFYFTVKENHNSSDYLDLMNGSSFVENGVNKSHIGLIKYISGLAYSRYLPLAGKVHTPHGYVTKLNNNSEPVNYQSIKDERRDVDVTLSIQLKRILEYLSVNTSVFEAYNLTDNPNINTNNIKTSTLR